MENKYPNSQPLSAIIVADKKSTCSVEFAYYVLEAENFNE